MKYGFEKKKMRQKDKCQCAFNFLVTSDKFLLLWKPVFKSGQNGHLVFLETSFKCFPHPFLSQMSRLSKHQEEGNQDICKFRFFGDSKCFPYPFIPQMSLKTPGRRKHICKFRFFGDSKCFPYPFISQMSLETPGGRKCLDCSWRRNKKQKCCGQKGGEGGNNC